MFGCLGVWMFGCLGVWGTQVCEGGCGEYGKRAMYGRIGGSLKGQISQQICCCGGFGSSDCES